MPTNKRIEKLTNVLRLRQPSLTVVMENIHDPHNVSACLRSCDAVGVHEVHLLYHSGQIFPKLGKKSSASAKKWLKYSKHKTTIECFNKLKDEGKKIYTTHLSVDSISLYDLDLTQPIALVFGNEHEGVSQEALELADGNFSIPQVGLIQSLNVSVACAVSLYEAYRQRNQKGMYNTLQFNEQEFLSLQDEWLSNKKK